MSRVEKNSSSTAAARCGGMKVMTPQSSALILPTGISLPPESPSGHDCEVIVNFN